MKNLQYLLSLHSVEGMGTVRLKRLLGYFKDPKSAWEANPKELKALGIPENVCRNFNLTKKSLDPEQYLNKISSFGIKILTFFDSQYPKNLKQIYDPPLILYYKGNILKQDDFAIGVVGTRKITGYGKVVTQSLTQKLALEGFTIVSGLAAGVDTIAHKTAIESNGRTLAVLGGGLNRAFPPQNEGLAQKIIEKFGACISEYPPDYPHLAGNFPSRNRIISGLSQAILVTEAAEDSGSLITASFAIEQGREVFAVPGPITSTQSLGTAKLIKVGAKLVTGIDDILEEFGLDNQVNVQNPKINLNLDPDEASLVNALKDEQNHIDELCRKLKKPASDISSLLLKLEIAGIVKNLGGGNYILLDGGRQTCNN